MKQLIVTLLFGVATVAVPSAAKAAECTLGGSTIVMTPQKLGGTSAMTPDFAVNQLYAVEQYQKSVIPCSKEQVLTAFVALNGSAPIPLTQQFKVPVLVAVTPPPAPVAPLISESTRAIAESEQKLADAERKLAEAQRQLALKEEECRVHQNAVASRAAAGKLTPAEAARTTTLTREVGSLKQLESRLKGQIKKINNELAEHTRRLNEHDRQIEQLKRGQNDSQLSAAKAKAAADTAQAAAEKSQSTADQAMTLAGQAKTAADSKSSGGLPWWQWAIIVFLLLLGPAIALLAWRRNNGSDERVNQLEERVADIEESVPNYSLEDGWQEKLNQLKVTEKADVKVLDGTDHVYTVTFEKALAGVKCVSGIRGQNPNSNINTNKLPKLVRKAAFQNRLDRPVE